MQISFEFPLAPVDGILRAVSCLRYNCPLASAAMVCQSMLKGSGQDLYCMANMMVFFPLAPLIEWDPRLLLSNDFIPIFPAINQGPARMLMRSHSTSESNSVCVSSCLNKWAFSYRSNRHGKDDFRR